MADTMKGLKRTHYCTEVTTADIGKEVVVAGFTQKQRDKGELVFIDLRDRTGIIQLTFDDKSDRSVIAKAKEVHSEYVLMAKGTVRRRESVNPDISTGEIEVFVTDLRILAKAQTRPSTSPMTPTPTRNCGSGTGIWTCGEKICRTT